MFFHRVVDNWRLRALASALCHKCYLAPGKYLKYGWLTVNIPTTVARRRHCSIKPVRYKVHLAFACSRCNHFPSHSDRRWVVFCFRGRVDNNCLRALACALSRKCHTAPVQCLLLWAKPKGLTQRYRCTTTVASHIIDGRCWLLQTDRHRASA